MEGQQADRRSQSHRGGDARQRTEQHFGRGAPRVAVGEMVLDDPAGIEAVLFGVADLRDDIVVKLRDLVVAALLDFELEEQTKFHARLRILAALLLAQYRQEASIAHAAVLPSSTDCLRRRFLTFIMRS